MTKNKKTSPGQTATPIHLQLTPEQVLAIRPSSELQARVSELLGRSKDGELSRQEETELERYLTLEHLVRLAKAHAHKQLAA